MIVDSDTIENVHNMHLNPIEIGMPTGKRVAKNMFFLVDKPAWFTAIFLPTLALHITSSFFEFNAVQRLLDYPEDFNFDAIITNTQIGPNLLGFLHKFNYPPFIGISPVHSSLFHTMYMGDYSQPSYIPFLSSDYSTNMSFTERIYNSFLYYLSFM